MNLDKDSVRVGETSVSVCKILDWNAKRSDLNLGYFHLILPKRYFISGFARAFPVNFLKTLPYFLIFFFLFGKKFCQLFRFWLFGEKTYSEQR